MTLNKQPKDLIIVGSGAIGIEFAYFYNSMGTNVTVVEYLPKIAPLEDDDISKELEKILNDLVLDKLYKKLPDDLNDIDKMVLDDCLSGSTMDRAEDVSPQYGGKVAAAARRIIDKLEKLGVEFSWAERWY